MYSTSTVDYCNWEVYIDGQNGDDLSLKLLHQDEIGSSNCGVYTCCYMLGIGLYHDIDKLVAKFLNKKFHEVFEMVNYNNILYFRKHLTVMIIDAHKFLRTK